MGFEIKFNDLSKEILSKIQENIDAANEAVGLAAEAHVKEAAPVGTPESTSIKNYHGGALRKSITHKVVNGTVFVGTNLRVTNNGKSVSYPIFVEFGTGIYADGGKGRKSPWVWKDKNGKYHFTRGIKPHHFLKNTISKAENIKEYKEIYENQLKKI